MGQLRAVIAAILGFFALGANACDSPTGPEVKPGEEFTLRAGQSATVSGSGMVVTFATVGNDSRCPSGVQCVWEGDAEVNGTVTTGSGAVPFTVHTSPRSGGSDTTVDGLSIHLARLDPYPKEGLAIPPATYAATLVVQIP